MKGSRPRPAVARSAGTLDDFGLEGKDGVPRAKGWNVFVVDRHAHLAARPTVSEDGRSRLLNARDRKFADASRRLSDNLDGLLLHVF
jgi:hypothetical protein